MSPVSTVPVGESMLPFRLAVYWLFNCPARQCPTEDDDDDYVVDPLNLLLALTLLGGDIDDDEEDSLDFPFYLSVEYNLWFPPPPPPFFWLCLKLANGLQIVP